MSESQTMVAAEQAQATAEQKQKQSADTTLFTELTANLTAQCVAELRSFVRDADNLSTANLAKMWVQGKRVCNLEKPEFKKSKTGEKVDPLSILDQLFKDVYRPSYLAKMRQLYQAFPTEADRDRLLAMRMKKSGRPLTWPHLEYLLKYYKHEQPRDTFDSMLQKTCENDWSPAELDEMIKQGRVRAGEAPTRGGGRPLNVPATFEGRMVRAIGQLEVFIKNDDAIYHAETYNPLTTLKGLPQAEVTAKKQEITGYVSRVRQLATQASQRAERLAKDMDEIDEFLKKCDEDSADPVGKKEAASIDDEDKT